MYYFFNIYINPNDRIYSRLDWMVYCRSEKYLDISMLIPCACTVRSKMQMSADSALNLVVFTTALLHKMIQSRQLALLTYHYDDVIMSALASQITSLMIVYSAVYSDVDQRKHQSSASLALVRGIHRRPMNFPNKGPATRKMFPFDDVIMFCYNNILYQHSRMM